MCSSDLHFGILCKLTKLHTTIDGMIELNRLQEISQSTSLMKITGPQISLFEDFYNFLSVLHMSKENSNKNSNDDTNEFYLKIMEENIRKGIKFSLYSIVNKYNPNLKDLENYEISPPTQLLEGMRVKVGRVSFDISLFLNKESIDINRFENIMCERSINNLESIKNHQECIIHSVTSEDICRICFSQSTPEMPLISLCKCKGSVQFYHLPCIRQWIETKRHKFYFQKSYSFHWRKLKCESCLSDFPIFIRFNGIIEPLVNIEFPQKKNCFILKSVVEDKNHYVSIHLCFSDNINETFTIGRSMETDIKIGDLSVSKSHALIKLDNNKLYLYDNNSKYGTYTEVIEGVRLDNERENQFLLDKNLLKIQLANSDEKISTFQKEIDRNDFKSYLSTSSTDSLTIEGSITNKRTIKIILNDIVVTVPGKEMEDHKKKTRIKS